MRFLLVEDEPVDAEFLLRAATGLGIDFDVAGTLAEADKYLQSHQYEAIITDLNLPDAKQLDAVHHFVPQACPVLVNTASMLDGLIDAARKAGAQGVVPKTTNPAPARERLCEIQELVTKQRELDEARDKGEVLDRILSDCQEIRERLQVLKTEASSE